MKLPMISYTSKLKIGWDLFMVCAVFASGLIIPYQIVSGSDPMGFLYWLITVVFCLDILLTFNTEAKTNLQVLADRKAVAKHYLSTWFVFDLLAALPLAPLLNLVSMHDLSGTTVYHVVTLFRLVRMLKLIKISTTFQSLEDLTDVPPALFRLIIFFFWFALIAHFVALGWIYIGAGEADRSFEDQYLRALYWCVTTITTIGYGDYTPNQNSNVQIIYTIIVQVIGVGMFGYIVGNVATLIVNIDAARAEFRTRIEEVRNYMRIKKIPRAIQDRVNNYYNYLWESRRGVTSQDFMRSLPQSLRSEISIYLNRDILKKVELFQDMDETFIYEVIEELEQTIFLPGDFIIRQGEPADCMYFLCTGHVEVTVDGQQVAILTEGSPFGEMALIKKERRNASVKALSYCDVYQLSLENFEKMRAKYPVFNERVLAIIAKRRRLSDR